MGRPLSLGSVYPFRAADTGRWSWVTGEPLTWEVGCSGSGLIETVPAGFLTDLGTVPWWARWAVNPADPELAVAFVLHDWLLRHHGPDCQLYALSQMYEALRWAGVPLPRRIGVALAVCLAIDLW